MKILKSEIIPETNLVCKHVYVKFEDGLVAYVSKNNFETYGRTTQEHVFELNKIQNKTEWEWYHMKMTKKSEKYIESYLKKVGELYMTKSLKDFKNVFEGSNSNVFTNGCNAYAINKDVSFNSIEPRAMEKQHVELFKFLEKAIGGFERYDIEIAYDEDLIQEIVDDANTYKKANIKRMKLGHKTVDPEFIIQASNILNRLTGIFEKSEDGKDWILLTGKYGSCYMLPLNPKNLD